MTTINISRVYLEISSETGVDFFNKLLIYLCQTLDVEYAFIGKLVKSELNKITTIAVANGGVIAQNFEYNIIDTPCHNVVNNKIGTICIYPRKIQKKFPKDHLLKEMKAESYGGIPLFNRKGEVIGLMAVLGCQPLKNPELAEEVLRVFAVRVAGEFERQEEDKNLRTLLARERLINQTALHIRQSLKLESIMTTTVAEVRDILKCDRVLVYKLNHDLSGSIVAESVGEGWRNILGVEIETTCYTNQLLENYQKGLKSWINNVDTANLTPEYRQLLQNFEVKANLIVPVIFKEKNNESNKLWGWLIAHQCSASREWEEEEVSLLEKLAIQLAIAIQQSQLYERKEREIIKRKAVEKKLRELNQELERRVEEKTNELRKINQELNYHKQALDQMALVSITDNKGKITYANDKFCEVCQYSLTEIIGAKHRIINSGYHPKSFFQELWQTIIKGELWRGEIKNKKKDGSYYWLDLTIVPFIDEDGKPFQYLAISVEITERKKAAEKLEESEAKLRKMINNMTEGILVINQEGLIRFVNPSTVQLLDYSQEELLNTHFGIPLESREYQEIQLLCKDYRTIFVDMRVTTINWEDELVYLVSLRDITEHKEAERKLRESRKLLQLVMDNIPQFIFWKDKNLRYLGCNKNFALSAGLTKAKDIVGKTDYDLPWSKEESKFYRECDRRVMETNQPLYNILEIQKNKTGKSIWLNTNKIPLHDEFNNVVGVLGTYEDITERKEAEEKQQQQLTAIEAAADGIAIIEGDKYVYVNEAYLKMFGYKKADELIGKNWRALYFTTEITRFEQEIIPLVMQNKNWRGEAIGKRKNGSTFPQELSLNITKDGKIICVCQDISKRKEIEAKINRSEAQFRAIFEQAAMGIAQTAINECFIKVNQKLGDMLGYSKDELITKTVSDISHPDDIEIDRQYLSKLLTGKIKTFSREKRYLHKNGSIIWGKITVSVVRKISGEPDYFIGVIEDISERKKAEADLENSETKLNSILNSMEDVVWSFKADSSELIYINKQVEKVYQRSQEEFYDNINLWLEMIHPEDRLIATKACEEMLIKGFKDIEYRILRPSGEIRWLRDRGTLIYGENGQPLRIDGIATDITEKKQAEEEIRKALAKEKELSCLKTRFITMTSHEFRTPLTVISSSAGILSTFGNQLSEEKKEEHLEIIQNSVVHITELLDDILTINRTETDTLKIKSETFELISFCERIVEEISLSTKTHTIVFTLDLTDDLKDKNKINAYLDKKILRQILMNLLANAVKYSPGGGQIHLILTITDNLVQFQVKDSGVGIPPEDKKHLFDSFYRGSNVEMIQGTGLGLAIVKKCVELQGGKVTFTSELNRGSTFFVTLPLK